MTARYKTRGIKVVGMTRERAWQIALDTVQVGSSFRDGADWRARRVADLDREGLTGVEIRERLGMSANAYYRARRRAREGGLIP